MGRKHRRKPEDAPEGGPRYAQNLLNAIPAETLDLHGHTGLQARQRVVWFVETAARKWPGGVVQIITGKGLHTTGRPVLGGVVEEALRNELRYFVADFALDPLGGSVRVQLKGGARE